MSDRAGERADAIPEAKLPPPVEPWVCSCWGVSYLVARAAQPEAGNEEGERWTMIRRRDWPNDHGSLVPRGAPVPEPDDRLEVFEVARVRAAHPEADRAPGEVETVARALVAAGCGSGWAYPNAPKIIAALDAARGRSRDDTGHLREALIETLRNDRSGLGTSEDAERIAGLVLGVLARFGGAGRAEGEDR